MPFITPVPFTGHIDAATAPNPPPRCRRLPHDATIALLAHHVGVPALGRRHAHACRSSCVGFLHGELGWWIDGEGEETGERGGYGREEEGRGNLGRESKV
jgi:hypothetical protein